MFAPDVHFFMFIGVILYSAGSFSLLLTNHPLAGLFPKITGFLMVCGQVVFMMSGSWFRVWSTLFEYGLAFKWIVGIDLLLTIIIWLRTIFLMPVGWVRLSCWVNVYHTSPIYCKLKIIKASRRQSAVVFADIALLSVDTFKKVVFSADFILLLAWLSAVNLEVFFFISTWGQFTRTVDSTNYKDRFKQCTRIKPQLS